MQPAQKPNTFSYILIILLLSLLSYAGYLSYKSIDYSILEKLEDTPLSIPPSPTTIIATPSSQIKNE